VVSSTLNKKQNAPLLTGVSWQFVKVPQKEFEKLQPTDFADLVVFAVST
jgi:hypothetical protein